jgi:hypothetical protein
MRRQEQWLSALPLSIVVLYGVEPETLCAQR